MDGFMLLLSKQSLLHHCAVAADEEERGKQTPEMCSSATKNNPQKLLVRLPLVGPCCSMSVHCPQGGVLVFTQLFSPAQAKRNFSNDSDDADDAEDADDDLLAKCLWRPSIKCNE